MKRLGKGRGAGISLDAPGRLLFHDEFIDTNGVLLSNHTPTHVNVFSLPWIKANVVDWEILNDQASLENYTPGYPGLAHKENDHYVEFPYTALTAEAILRADSLTDFSVITLATRFTNFDSHFSWQFQQVNSHAVLEFRRQEVGTSLILFSEDIGGEFRNKNVTLKIVDDGDTMTCYFNDVEKFSISTATYASATGVGIKAQSTFAKFIDFKVRKT